MIQLPFAIMFIVDYIITYFELFLGIAYEANPFMQWMFTLPFQIGLLTRIEMCGIIYMLLWTYRGSSLYKPAIKVATVFEGIVLTWHMVILCWSGI